MRSSADGWAGAKQKQPLGGKTTYGCSESVLPVPIGLKVGTTATAPTMERPCQSRLSRDGGLFNFHLFTHVFPDSQKGALSWAVF